VKVCMLTTCYPRWPGDPDGWFVAALAQHLARRQDTSVSVLAPAALGAPASEREGRLEVVRVPYFRPARLQKLAHGHGIPWNLRHSALAWANVPPFLGAFAARLCWHTARADVVHAHWGILGALAVLMRPVHGRPVVVTVHGSDLSTRIAPIRWTAAWAVRHADAVTTPSREFHARCCALRGRAQGCEWIPNGVELPAWEEIERGRSRPGGARVVTVGRLIPERRHDLLIRAFAEVARRIPSAVLTIVGDGPEAGRLAGLAGELGVAGAVRMAGKVPHADVPRHLLDADLYVSPTTVETFGLATVEAAAHGLPIVTTRVGFPATLVSEGNGGLVVEPGDAGALGAAMLEVLSDPVQARRMGRRIYRRVDELGLTWARCAERVAGVYSAAVGRRHT